MATILVTGTPGQNISGPGGATNLVLLAGTHGNGKIGQDGTYGYLANTGAVARQIYGSPETPASPDYHVEFTRAAVGYAFDTHLVGGVRYSSDGQTGYEAEHDIDAGRVFVYKVVGGQRSGPIISWQGYADTVRLAVSGTGATVTLTLTAQGVQRGTYEDTAPDRITLAGVWGGGWVGSASSTNTSTGGVNLASIGSDAYTGAPANTAPTVSITHPSAASLAVPAGTKLVFTATATDVENGSLTGSIAWSSSNPADGTGGSLGPAGGSVTVDTTGWAGGQRTITANVTDAGGLSAVPDSFTLTIGAGSTLILEDDVQQEILQGGVAATVRVPLRDPTGALLESNPLAPGDVKKSVDGGAAAVLAGDAGAAAWTVVNGFLNVPLSAAEVAGSEITLFIEDQDGSAYLDRVVKIMVVGYDPRATPASTTQIAGAVGDALAARLAS